MSFLIIGSIIAGFGTLIMIFPELVDFFTLKHKTELDKTFEEFNRTHQENITRKKRRGLGAFILSIGVVLNIIIIAFWN